MRREEGSELQACHGVSLRIIVLRNRQVPNYGVGQGKAILRARRQRMVVAQSWLTCRSRRAEITFMRGLEGISQKVARRLKQRERTAALKLIWTGEGSWKIAQQQE
jgi:hypothetical protein